ncbi:MAG: 4'-phosphopantetheinyl transferase superfamily protein [Pseudomonadota bacterium]|nr:4'-phosphopantetheinyl transferase superfamily protein [Pseudomonadota bacterium]
MSAISPSLLSLIRTQRVAAPGNGESLLLLFKAPASGTSLDEVDQRLLRADEAARATRFRRPEDRDAFVAARIVVRTLLAGWRGLDPGSIEFQYSTHGKPSLLNAGDLHFNVAHCGRWVAMAFADVPVGVDIEAPLTASRTAMALAGFLAPREREALTRCPESRRSELFIRFWTLKEAYLKARGIGLSVALDSFEFELSIDKPDIGFLSPSDDRADGWQFVSADVCGSLRWALAMNSSIPRSNPAVIEL